MGRGLNLG
jgi:hypothetical protein